MFYQEKRTLVSVVSGALILLAYCVFALTRILAGGAEILSDLRFWAVSMLIFVGVSVAAMIVIQIVFHIVNAVANEIKGEEQDATDTEDEMDKLIALKASKFSSNILSVGVILALVSAAFGLPVAILMNVLYLFMQVSCLLEGCMQLRYYKRGIRNG